MKIGKAEKGKSERKMRKTYLSETVQQNDFFFPTSFFLLGHNPEIKNQKRAHHELFKIKTET